MENQNHHVILSLADAYGKVDVPGFYEREEEREAKFAALCALVGNCSGEEDFEARRLSIQLRAERTAQRDKEDDAVEKTMIKIPDE